MPETEWMPPDSEEMRLRWIKGCERAIQHELDEIGAAKLTITRARREITRLEKRINTLKQLDEPTEESEQ